MREFVQFFFCISNYLYSQQTTENEEKGLSSLTKRINNGEIMVATSDKSGRFVVLKTEQYIRSGLKHTTQDQEIGPEELKRIQTVLNSHTKWLKNIFNIGATWGHEDRFAVMMEIFP